jgi:hypothetical protein
LFFFFLVTEQFKTISERGIKKLNLLTNWDPGWKNDVADHPSTLTSTVLLFAMTMFKSTMKRNNLSNKTTAFTDDVTDRFDRTADKPALISHQ